jgi:hypothetical protein
MQGQFFHDELAGARGTEKTTPFSTVDHPQALVSSNYYPSLFLFLF